MNGWAEPEAGLPAQPHDLAVIVQNVSEQDGRAMVALCREDEYLQGGCALQRKEDLKARQSLTLAFAEVPPGRYAIQAFLDVNGNGDLDRLRLFQVPQEPIGFSRNPTVKFGPPSFDSVAFSLPAPERAGVRVELRPLLQKPE